MGLNDILGCNMADETGRNGCYIVHELVDIKTFLI